MHADAVIPSSIAELTRMHHPLPPPPPLAYWNFTSIIDHRKLYILEAPGDTMLISDTKVDLDCVYVGFEIE